MILRSTLAALALLGPAIGCGEKAPKLPEKQYEVWTSDKPPEPELTIEEQRAKLEAERENQPEPKLDPNDPREKHELVWKESKSALKGIYEERSNVITQARGVKFDEKLADQEKRYKPLVDEIEGFGIGEKPEDLDTAAARLCKLDQDLRAGADQLAADGEAKLKEIDQAIAELEAKQKEGKPVTTRQYEKLEDERKVWSAPVLGAKYIYMALRTIYDEALVLADKGARRSQIALRDCLGKPDAKPVPYELAEDARLKVVKRAKYYLP